MKKLTIITLFIVSTIQIFGQTTIFFDDFDNGTNPAWEFNFSGEGLVDVQNNIGFNNTAGARIGKSVDGVFTTQSIDLPPLDLSTFDNVEMTFLIKNNWDETHPEDGIYFSNDGGDTFYPALDFKPSDWCPNIWGQFPPLDIDDLAAQIETASGVFGLDLTANFVIRIQQRGNSNFNGAASNNDGFYIDNVHVYDPELLYHDLAETEFTDDFEANALKLSWSWDFADATSSFTDVTTPLNFVGVVDGVGINGTKGMMIGRRCDGLNTTNAMDLHLDLSETPDVEMTFFIRNNWDETHSDDGIYFSNDGGNTFYPALDFKPGIWCPNVWGQFPPLDIDDLAAQIEISPGIFGLDLSSTFVVRIQQRGDSNFDGAASNNDGFVIDNVRVYEPGLVYHDLAGGAFSDDFEANNLNSSWSWNFAEATSSFTDVTTPLNFVGLVDAVGINGTKGMMIGRRCDGLNTTNAMDLHLDLSETPDVEMTFLIRNNWDETHSDDGIFFSNDGGDTFYPALYFKPSDWCPNIWGGFPPLDIDDLAAQVETSPGVFGLDLSATFVVRIQQRGDSNFDGAASNNDGFFIDNVNVYQPGLVYHDLVAGAFSDDFEANNLNASWSWNFADSSSLFTDVTTPLNFVGIVDGVGINNTNGMMIGRRCDGWNTTNAIDLHLDLSATPDVEMTFLIRNNWDETHPDDGIFFSNDGGDTFYPALYFKPSDWCPNVWGGFPPLDIDDLAAQIETSLGVFGLDLSATFVVRIQQRGDSNFDGAASNNDGFVIDNVNVYQPGLVYHDLNEDDFFDNFENEDLNASWSWNFADSSSSFTDVTTPLNFVGLVDGVGIAGTKGMMTGRRCDGLNTTNAMDLHLDLSATPAVGMTFWFRNNWDETHSDDGIYFSNDGGDTFYSALLFKPSDWCPNVWGQFPPLDIDKLAAQIETSPGAFGLDLTATFVVRIQQRGDSNFDGAASNNDGFFIDDVRVYKNELVYHNLAVEDFIDDFEAENLKTSWSWNFADSSSMFTDVTSPLNLVALENTIGVSSTKGVRFGRRCNGNGTIYSTNAFDLHLDLNGSEEVQVSFWIRNNNNISDEDDGIYFSDNGGASFQKVYEYSNLNNSIFEQRIIEISTLASDNLLNKNAEQFVIRFQQRGDGNGFIIDDVNVMGMLSFVDDLAKEWKDLLIIPNPTTNYITISSAEGISIKNGFLVVTNTLGQNVIREEFNSIDNTLDVSELPEGYYFLSILVDGGSLYHAKFLKE